MKVIIALGGEPCSGELVESCVEGAALIIAADRGYHLFDEVPVLPNILVGDFDSIGRDLKIDGVEVIPAPEQTATDFEKALRYLPESCRELIVLGGTGRRDDHFLTNLLIAAGVRAEVRIEFRDDFQAIYRIVPGHDFERNLSVGRTVSLIPFTQCGGVTTSGLKWNLENADMGIGVQLGQSNVVEMDIVKVTLGSGFLYVFENV